jgi:hypothetical protein
VLGAWTVSADDKKDKQKPVTDAVVKVAAGLDPDKPAGARKQAEALVGKYGLEAVMKTSRPVSSGGIGLEARIRALSRNPLSKEELTRQAGAISRLGRVGVVIALGASARPSVKKEAEIKEWQGYAKEMQEASAALVKAVKAGDAGKVMGAAGRLNTSCSACHAAFRKGDD